MRNFKVLVLSDLHLDLIGNSETSSFLERCSAMISRAWKHLKEKIRENTFRKVEEELCKCETVIIINGDIFNCPKGEKGLTKNDIEAAKKKISELKERWKAKIFFVPGNHDIGFRSFLSKESLVAFQKATGSKIFDSFETESYFVVLFPPLFAQISPSFDIAAARKALVKELSKILKKTKKNIALLLHDPESLGQLELAELLLKNQNRIKIVFGHYHYYFLWFCARFLMRFIAFSGNRIIMKLWESYTGYLDVDYVTVTKVLKNVRTVMVPAPGRFLGITRNYTFL